MPTDRTELARHGRELLAHGAFGLRTALEAVRHNKLRAALTSLGILFGVASVIAMLAVGKGAEQEILEQMRLLGSNNVMITPLVEQKEGKADEEPTREVKKYSPGPVESFNGTSNPVSTQVLPARFELATFGLKVRYATVAS